MVRGEHNDLWSVNTDQEYLEEVREELQNLTGDVTGAIEGVLTRVFLKLDRIALGVSLGLTSGIGLFLATLILVLKGGFDVGQNLQLLSQYYPGYSVTVNGSLLGLFYGFISGFIGGWTFAFVRNSVMFFYMAGVYRRSELYLLRKLFDYF
jgi:hypothetical protein